MYCDVCGSNVAVFKKWRLFFNNNNVIKNWKITLQLKKKKEEKLR